jgi:fermentation-respiration switch protein FrsA (DUF1100 family)
MLKFAFALVTVLVILWLLVRLLESRIAFFPVAGEHATPGDFGIDFEPVALVTRDGERLRAWSLIHPAPRARIVYFHGNGGNLSIWTPILAGIARSGYSVIAFDYRGYGNSSGRPTERGLYRDVDAVIEEFWARSPPGPPVVYWGRSLGVAMAAYAATRVMPDGLILESGFPDVRSLVRTSPLLAFFSLFSTYRFPCAEFLQQLPVPAPVLVMHGDDDHVIPIAQGRALFERISGPKAFFTIHGGDHNDTTPPDPSSYWQAVDGFITRLPKRESR